MMQYSQSGEVLTKGFESCRLIAYPDSTGIPTIAWGHTRNVKLGDTCTQEQADKWLDEDLKWAINEVNKEVTCEVSQNEFDALVDFVFNCGSGNFEHSTLLKLVDSGDHLKAAQEFEKWDHAAGKVVAGLLRRRLAEKEEFLAT